MVCDILCTKGEKIYMYLIEYIGERRKKKHRKDMPETSEDGWEHLS